MSYFKKVKGFLQELGHDIVEEYVQDNMLVISNDDAGINQMFLDIEGDLLIMEQKLVEVKVEEAKLFKELLKINRQLVFGAFVLDESGKNLLFRDTLELANLDLNELEASLSSLALGLVESYDLLVLIAGEE